MRCSNLFVLAVAGLLVASGADAVPILDQYSFTTVPTTGGVGFCNCNSNDGNLAQTVTAGSTGTLEEVRLVVNNQWSTIGGNPNFFFDIRPIEGGFPVEDNSLAFLSRQISLTTSGQTLITISDLGLSLTAGDIFALVLRGEAGGAFEWLGGQYAGGGAYARNVSDPNNFNYSWTGPREFPNAFAFQTYIECSDPLISCNPAKPPPVSVPEPTTLSLFGAGLLAMFVRRRRSAV